MASRESKMGLALVLMTSMWASSLAQLNCPPPVVSFQSCIGFITSSSLTPSPQCCSQLASMVQSQAPCLCTIMNAVPQLPFNVNRTQAITLPGACNIQAPPLSQCNAASGSSVPAVGSPNEAPSAAIAPSPTLETTPSAPSGISPPIVPSAKGGSKAGPTKGQQASSARSSPMFTPSLFFFLLLVAAALSSY